MSDVTDAIAIGIDLGGTNLRVAAYRGLAAAARRVLATGATGDAAAGVTGDAAAALAPPPIAQRKERVGEPRDPDRVVARIAEIVDELLAGAGAGGGAEIIPVGVGIAALLRGHDGVVANSPHLRWRDVPFGALLRERLGPRRRIGVYNDVNAITWGEVCFGAGVGARDVLAVYVGTGVGAGLVVDGRLVEGASNTAGELGHVKVVLGDGAAPCACGGRGCVEAYVGGAYLQARARAELRGGARSLAIKLAGGADEVTPGHLDQAAGDGDDYALELFAEIAPLFAAALGNAIALLNPARLILGGGVWSRTPVLRDHVLTALAVATPPTLLEPLTIMDAALGDDAGLLGSALLAAMRGRGA